MMSSEDKSSSSPMIMRRWRVCRACDGYTFEFDLKRSDDVETLQREISKRTEIDVKSQIVLYGPPFKRLLKTKSLRRAVGKDIFVFDRRHLTRTNLPIAPVELNAAYPISKKKKKKKKGGERRNIKGTSPMFRVLHDYSQQFEHSLDTARAYLTANSQRIRACMLSLNRQTMIRRAWEAASTSTTHIHTHTLFNTQNTQVRIFRNIVTRPYENFENSIDRIVRNESVKAKF